MVCVLGALTFQNFCSFFVFRNSQQGEGQGAAGGVGTLAPAHTPVDNSFLKTYMQDSQLYPLFDIMSGKET
jgi:hypothetical protein